MRHDDAEDSRGLVPTEIGYRLREDGEASSIPDNIAYRCRGEEEDGALRHPFATPTCSRSRDD